MKEIIIKINDENEGCVTTSEGITNRELLFASVLLNKKILTRNIWDVIRTKLPNYFDEAYVTNHDFIDAIASLYQKVQEFKSLFNVDEFLEDILSIYNEMLNNNQNINEIILYLKDLSSKDFFSKIEIKNNSLEQ